MHERRRNAARKFRIGARTDSFDAIHRKRLVTRRAGPKLGAIDFGRTLVMNCLFPAEFELACRDLSRLPGGVARRERASFSSMVSAATLTILGEELRITIHSGRSGW